MVICIALVFVRLRFLRRLHARQTRRLRVQKKREDVATVSLGDMEREPLSSWTYEIGS